MPLAATPLGSLVEQHREEIVAIVRRHKGRSIAVFGSVARGEDGPQSDIDFLVELEPEASLFDLIHIEDDLRALLAVDLDVVSVGALRPRDRRIRSEVVPL